MATSSPRPRTSSTSTRATSSSASTTTCVRSWSGWTFGGPTWTTRSRATGVARSGAPYDRDRPPEAGEGQRAGLGLDRVARRGRQVLPWVDPNNVLRTAPRPADLAVDEERARPDARRPEPRAAVRVRDEQLALVALQQEVGVAARQQAGGRGGGGFGAHCRLVGRQHPLLAERRADRHQLGRERVERVDRRTADARPGREPLGRARPEDVQVAAHELAARVGGVDLGCG